MRALWGLLAVFALVTIVAGTWRSYVQTMQIDPAFSRLGLITEYTDDGYTIGWFTDAAKAAGVIDGSALIAVDGRRVTPGLSEEAAATALRGPTGWVAVTLRAPDGKVGTVRLERGDHIADGESVISDSTFFAASTGVGVVSALVLFVAAAMLARRRFDDPVSLALSIGFLLLITGLPLGDVWWDWVGHYWVSQWASGLFLVLFFATVPAFPDGHYRPRWTGWLAVLAAPAVLIASPEATPTSVSLAIVIGFGLAAAIVPLLRFRATPPGLERQQLKWAGAGFLGAMATLGFAVIAMWLGGETQLLPKFVGAGVRLAGICMLQLAMVILPLGVLVSMLKYRLWDADAVIGRSAGWAILTLLAGAVWAGSTAAIEEIIEGTMGDSNKGLAAAASTVFALLVLAPAHDRVVSWMDARFRANILRLRALPQRLQIWQHSDTPEDIGARVTNAIVDSLHTDRAAMLLHVGDRYHVVGAEGVDVAQVSAWVEAHGSGGKLDTPFVERGDALFPLRLVLDDAGAPIGALLLGPRSDGSLYGRDERAALGGIETPLAAALRQAQRRRVSDARMAALIGELEGRLKGLERGVAA